MKKAVKHLSLILAITLILSKFIFPAMAVEDSTDMFEYNRQLAVL